MNVLHINTSTSRGGAAIAAYRHAEAMSRAGVNAHFLAKTGVELPLSSVVGYKLGDRVWDYALFKMTEFLRRPYHSFSFMTRSYGIKSFGMVQEADVVYLHWVNNFLGFCDIDYLLSSKKRVIWFLHDMWPMTGGCHHSLTCLHYLTDCKNCEQLLRLDSIAHLQHKKKMKRWLESDSLVIASPSQWLAERAKESALFHGRRIITCPNVIDTDLYKPTNKRLEKEKLGLNSEKKYVLFGSAVGASNAFKGMGYLYEALRMIDPMYEMISMGRIGDDYPSELLHRTHQLGYVSDEQQKVNIYNAADVFVIPSLAENFPNMVIEAMSCGVPAVGFKIGGITEQISHKENGFLVDTVNASSLAEGIEWVLANPNQERLSDSCREYAYNRCSYDFVLRNHQDLLDL